VRLLSAPTEVRFHTYSIACARTEFRIRTTNLLHSWFTFLFYSCRCYSASMLRMPERPLSLSSSLSSSSSVRMTTLVWQCVFFRHLLALWLLFPWYKHKPLLKTTLLFWCGAWLIPYCINLHIFYSRLWIWNSYWSSKVWKTIFW
jgi:hypothetical protein